MKRRAALLLSLAALLALPVSGIAQAPAAAATFPHAVTFRTCTESWVFACGMRDESGRTYGTAHQVMQCSQYELRPDGSMTLSPTPGVVDSRGRYRIVGRTVHIEYIDEAGEVRHRESYELSEDRRTLGDMQLVEPAPAEPATVDAGS